MADDIPPSISIAAVIMPSLDSKHLTPKAYHKGRIQCGHQIPFEEKSSCQMVQEKMIDFCAKQFQVPRTLTEKTAPSAHMPSKQRARGCHASETLPVGQANRQPQKTKKILEPARIETVSKNFQKRYNLNWEEVHGHASLWFLAEFKRGIALLPILFKPFQSLKHVLQKSRYKKISFFEQGWGVRLEGAHFFQGELGPSGPSMGYLKCGVFHEGSDPPAFK
jgi:hypothetical protein